MSEEKKPEKAKKRMSKSPTGVKMPVAPDPYWPGGAEQLHLTPIERENEAIIGAFSAIKGELWKCAKCGADSNQSKTDATLCETCSRENAQVTSMQKKVNSGWMDLAVELGIELFERQPEETDTEWRIWTTYRGYYPLKLPTYAELAAHVGCSMATVVKAAQKWSYKVRLMSWARFTDADIQEKRIRAVREMNDKQLTMAQTIQDKLRLAIDNLNPEALKPNELVNLFKVATELERRITTYVEEEVKSSAAEVSTKPQMVTKLEDIGEIVGILQKTGVMQGKQLGVEQITRVVVKEDE